jgi:heat-inducible transcriptional repressor
MEQQSDFGLSERQRSLLSLIIEEYTKTARPVASEQIVSQYFLAISSATVRNDMADLERAGLISHPHTSAGRVPTDKGYRFFVENLMRPRILRPDEQRTIRHQFHQIEMDADECVRLAASVLARSVHTAAVATAPMSTDVRLKHVQLISVSDVRVLLVAVGSDGSISQQIITAEEPWEQERLNQLSAQLNAALFDMTSEQIGEWTGDEEKMQSQPPLARRLLPILADMLSRLERPEATRIYREGLVNILEQPEFRDPGKMQQVFELFERTGLWSSIISSVLHSEGVQVIIGDEALGQGMSSLSVVLARYGLEDKLAGVLGVIGPMRMPYSRSVSTVRYMSELLSDLLFRAYNPYTDAGGDE